MLAKKNNFTFYNVMNELLSKTNINYRRSFSCSSYLCEKQFKVKKVEFLQDGVSSDVFTRITEKKSECINFGSSRKIISPLFKNNIWAKVAELAVNKNKFEMSTVDKRLIRGASLNLISMLELKAKGCNLIIDLRKADEMSGFNEKFFASLLGIKYVNHPYSFWKGPMPSKEDFYKIADLISNSKGKVYLHCKNGRHRTSIFTAAYNLIKNSKSFDEVIQKDVYAYNFSNRKFISPSEATSNEELEAITLNNLIYDGYHKAFEVLRQTFAKPEKSI